MAPAPPAEVQQTLTVSLASLVSSSSSATNASVLSVPISTLSHSLVSRAHPHVQAALLVWPPHARRVSPPTTSIQTAAASVLSVPSTLQARALQFPPRPAIFRVSLVTPLSPQVASHVPPTSTKLQTVRASATLRGCSPPPPLPTHARSATLRVSAALAQQTQSASHASRTQQW